MSWDMVIATEKKCCNIFNIIVIYNILYIKVELLGVVSEKKDRVTG